MVSLEKNQMACVLPPKLKITRIAIKCGFPKKLQNNTTNNQKKIVDKLKQFVKIELFWCTKSSESFTAKVMISQTNQTIMWFRVSSAPIMINNNNSMPCLSIIFCHAIEFIIKLFANSFSIFQCLFLFSSNIS